MFVGVTALPAANAVLALRATRMGPIVALRGGVEDSVADNEGETAIPDPEALGHHFQRTSSARCPGRLKAQATRAEISLPPGMGGNWARRSR